MKWLVFSAVTLAIILALFLVIGPEAMVRFQFFAASVGNGYYAVYLDNDQALYGRIAGWSGNSLRLTDVYYLQNLTVGEKTTANLLRRGGVEITQPENYLVINRDHILYWEKIGPDSQVMKVIRGGQ